ncbi:hypothetical protein [Klebsiella pneumoniae]|uniref:hypothetical protein n=1 Tax=Klebsiella pneumoniae TaxID=573 RepID=UPI00388D0B54
MLKPSNCTPGCAPEKSRTLCWYDFGVQAIARGCHRRKGWRFWLPLSLHGRTLALDDALDVLDAMLAVIIRDARKIGQKKRLRSLKDLDKSALALASACSYLLKEEETPDESIRVKCSSIPRQKLAEIITLVREIARPSDDKFSLKKWWSRYGRVRRFLPHLLNTVKFSSAPAGVTTLNACDYLSREFQLGGSLTTHQLGNYQSVMKQLVINRKTYHPQGIHALLSQ